MRNQPQDVYDPSIVRTASKLGIGILMAAFVASRVAFYLAGGVFDLYPLNRAPADSVAWQVLDPHLLRTDLLGSLWYLHSQPPLFNLFCGLLLKLPSPAQRTVAAGIYMGLGLVLVLTAYLTMVALRVPGWLALAVGLALVVDPSNLLFENWLFYAYPTAAALSVGSLCCVRYLQSRRRSWGFGFFLAISFVVLLNSSYQIIWIAILLAVVFGASATNWRQVTAVAIVPLLFVAGWLIKDAFQFGTFTTSSWFGMNLARTTLSQAPPGLVDQLVKRGTLAPLAEVGPFAPVSFYAPRFVPVPHTGHPVLDARFKTVPKDSNVLLRYANTNLNNLVYVEVSQRFLREDLAYIRAEPGQYFATVAKAGSLWFVASDDYDFVQSNRSHIEPWARVYDMAVLWQPQMERHIQLSAFRRTGPNASQISYATILVFAIGLFGGPWVAWRRRRCDRAGAATLVVLWLTIVYAAASSFIEFGENERFRFELGPLPLVLAAAVTGYLFESRRGRSVDRSLGPDHSKRVVSGDPQPNSGPSRT